MSVQDHYDQLLGPIYSWMVGDLDAAFARAEAELDALELRATEATAGVARTIVDLGAGFGLHSIPLARRGYDVIAVDGHEPLLKELTARAGSLPIRTVHADLMDFRKHLPDSAAAILCMGDTLTHLRDAASVEALFAALHAALVPGGLFTATFRDYSSKPPENERRFILVRSDERRILTCFLEYGDAIVQVHDLLHEREEESWRLRVSRYPKLRLSPDWVMTTLAARGFTVRREPGFGGMIRCVAQRN